MSAEAPAKTATLAERILAITAEMPPIKATGKSPFSKEPALSIEDVEDAVRPLLVKHGLVIHFSTRHLIRSDKEWVAEITAHIGGDFPLGEPAYRSIFFDADWADSGSTPAAAYSFARKSYLKQLFHIAGEDDAAPTAQNGSQGATAAAPVFRTAGKPKVISKEDTGRVCPECGADLELVTWDNHRSAIACSGKVNGEWCKYREAVADQTPIPFA